MGFGASAKVSEIDVTGFVATDGNDVEAGHNGAGGIGAVGRSRDQTNIAVRFAAIGVVSVDDEEAGVFALGAGIGLK